MRGVLLASLVGGVVTALLSVVCRGPGERISVAAQANEQALHRFELPLAYAIVISAPFVPISISLHAACTQEAACRGAAWQHGSNGSHTTTAASCATWVVALRAHKAHKCRAAGGIGIALAAGIDSPCSEASENVARISSVSML